MYHISYGPIHKTAETLQEARKEAKRISRGVLYAIRIVHNGDVIETLCPKIDKSGRFTFRTVKGDKA